MKKLIQKIRTKLIHLLGGEIVSPVDKRPIKIIEYRPRIRTIVAYRSVRLGDCYIPPEYIEMELARNIGMQIIKFADMQTTNDFKLDTNEITYRAKVDIIEGMDVRETEE